MSRSSSTLGGRLLAIAASALTPLAVLAAPAAAAPPGVPAAMPESVPGAWIVTLDAGATPDGVAAEHSRRYSARVDHLYRYAVNGYAAHMSDQAAAKVAQDPRVASVERDQEVTVAAQSTPTGINRIDGELSSTVAGDGSGDVIVDVAVLDTGIATHTDLTVAGGRNCTGGSKTAYGDRHGHGTHVAGTIAAKDDGNGVVGVAPGARLWAVKVLNDQGSGTRSGIICGIDWVTANAGTIEVANMSLGGVGTEPPGAPGSCGTGDAYHDSICRSVGVGVTYVVAAGNSSADSAGHVPAAYDEVITVSALSDSDGEAGGTGGAPSCRADEDDTFANFSNYGTDVDLIAPGVCIASTWPGGGYHTISGTSMASPHVAGAAALYKAANPGASPATVKSELIKAGNSAWNDVDDPDVIKEALLNVDGF